MSLPLLIHGLGSIGVFATRAFLPAFATALLLRFGPQIPWLAHAGTLAQVKGVPTWFTSDIALVVLGLLSLLELVAERVPEAKSALDEVHDLLKTGMAALTFLGVLGATDRGALLPILDGGWAAEGLPALAVGAGTFFASKARGAALSPLVQADEDDDLGLQGLGRWVGDLWGALGPLALLALPLLTLGAFGIAMGAIALAGRAVEAREEATKVACEACERPIYACATACPFCHAPVKSPRGVGVLGGTLTRDADPGSHPFRLVAAKRCPACATRYARRAVKQACEACGYPLMDDPEFARRYVGFVDRRVVPTVVVCTLLGLIPVLGVIPGVVAYRLWIVAPFRRYIPPGRGFVLRWGVRLVVLAMVATQWVPLAGGFALPVMALVNYAAYRGAYRKLALS